jgi:hypothetical protein
MQLNRHTLNYDLYKTQLVPDVQEISYCIRSAVSLISEHLDILDPSLHQPKKYATLETVSCLAPIYEKPFTIYHQCTIGDLQSDSLTFENRFLSPSVFTLVLDYLDQ